jgi:Cap4 dsDNA endonuclease
MAEIHQKPPRETVGRETTSRFRMQHQAAAFASLEILSGAEIDYVYCDYHDDFVVRHRTGNSIKYHFFQVKTKGKANQQWTIAEIFSLKKTGNLDTKQKLKEIRESIAGKLLTHTIQFEEHCREVTILSNVHFHDDVLEVISHIQKGVSHKKYINQLIENFSGIFSPDMLLTKSQLKSVASRFSLMPNVQHMGDTLEAFADSARTAIWKHSEIDLQKHETDEIANSLVSLVMSKSCAPLRGISKENLDSVTGIGLEDLLTVLSISTEVYRNLREGGDESAIKVASILQRQLKAAGATEVMIETASREKVSWDVWLRTARHIFSDLDLDILIAEIDSRCKSWLLSGGKLSDLSGVIDTLLHSDICKKFTLMDKDKLFGGFCSSIVRRAAK